MSRPDSERIATRRRKAVAAVLLAAVGVVALYALAVVAGVLAPRLLPIACGVAGGLTAGIAMALRGGLRRVGADGDAACAIRRPLGSPWVPGRCNATPGLLRFRQSTLMPWRQGSPALEALLRVPALPVGAAGRLRVRDLMGHTEFGWRAVRVDAADGPFDLAATPRVLERLARDIAADAPPGPDAARS